MYTFCIRSCHRVPRKLSIPAVTCRISAAASSTRARSVAVVALKRSSTGGVTSRLVFVRQFARTDRRGNLEPFKRCPTPDFSPAGVGRSRARRERRYTRNRIRSNLLEEENPRQNLFRNVFKTRCVDFAKAFDTVSHNKLIHKLSCYGISGSLLHWIESFLSCRTQQTHVGKLPVVHFTYM